MKKFISVFGMILSIGYSIIALLVLMNDLTSDPFMFRHFLITLITLPSALLMEKTLLLFGIKFIYNGYNSVFVSLLLIFICAVMLYLVGFIFENIIRLIFFALASLFQAGRKAIKS
jgi:hypothetical protein